MANPMTTILDGVYDLIEADATFVNVYAWHNVADIVLPAITVGPVSVEPRQDDAMMSGAESIMPWDVKVSVRVHTSYTGGMIDQSGAVTLVDSVIEKLRQNLDTVVGCHLLDLRVEYGQDFSESQTMGAQVSVTVLAHEHYTQE